MVLVHLLGFPRIGPKRELKTLLENRWKRNIDEAALLKGAEELQQRHWSLQKDAGMDLCPVGDFSLYDHVLDAQLLVGVVPPRFGFSPRSITTDQYFELARGNKEQPAMDMKKWFDTNYHYIVPEWHDNTSFEAQPERLVSQIKRAEAMGVKPKAVLVGPVSLLWLGKAKGTFSRLSLLDQLAGAYERLLEGLVSAGVEWVQIDEPILGLDLSAEWLEAFSTCYHRLSKTAVKLLLTTYFSGAEDHAGLVKSLPVEGVHLDLVRAPGQLEAFMRDGWPAEKVLSLGVIDGRNVWRADISKVLSLLKPLKDELGERLWIAPSCSLLSCPFDVSAEAKMDEEVKGWLAFSLQKMGELTILKRCLTQGPDEKEIEKSNQIRLQREQSQRIHRPDVRQRMEIEPEARRNSPYTTRAIQQQEWMKLPLLPTTSIGSFPQTAEIRYARSAFRRGAMSLEEYEKEMKKAIERVIRFQEKIGMDVLVHGEAERNDMVEYFGEQLSGFVFTSAGWVQSYGSRCVKPPILFGDVARKEMMTVKWTTYAQSLTVKPVKGMLTGPVTILQWSFVRDDLPRDVVCRQIALSLNDEVRDLETAGVRVIQIDEPALREGLPLKVKDRSEYLEWASYCFRVASAGVKDSTQIHTHMCYSEFEDVLDTIAALDADIIAIETSRSNMELLNAFKSFRYPNAVGPGVYDIHSPRVPTKEEIRRLLTKALEVFAPEMLWANPDCGLKTREWSEVEPSLTNMVLAARELREELKKAVEVDRLER